MMFSGIPWRRVLRIFGALVFIFGILAHVFTNETSILVIQNGMNLPGKTFDIGIGRFAKSSKWILLSNRSESGTNERLYGFLPVFRQFGPVGRFFSFRDTTNSSIHDFVILEPPTESIHWARVILSGDPNATLPENCKPTFVDQYRQMSLACRQGDEIIIYFPDLNIAISRSANANMDALPRLIHSPIPRT